MHGIPNPRVLTVLGLCLIIGAGSEPVIDHGGGTDGEARAMRIVVNLPAHRLDVFENGERTRSYSIAIGQPGHRTPRGRYTISRAVWNPWWHPPDRAWARGKSPTPPGPGNPMGRVKLYFRNLYFVHGTPAVQSLGRPASHGCVRMRNADAIELARLVHRYGSPGVSGGEIDRLVDRPRSTRTIWLERGVPLEIVYDVAEVHDGRLHIHPDVYGLVGGGLRELAVQALVRAGHDSTQIDREALDDLVRRGRSASVSAPTKVLVPDQPVAAVR